MSYNCKNRKKKYFKRTLCMCVVYTHHIKANYLKKKCLVARDFPTCCNAILPFLPLTLNGSSYCSWYTDSGFISYKVQEDELSTADAARSTSADTYHSSNTISGCYAVKLESQLGILCLLLPVADKGKVIFYHFPAICAV